MKFFIIISIVVILIIIVPLLLAGFIDFSLLKLHYNSIQNYKTLRNLNVHPLQNIINRKFNTMDIMRRGDPHSLKYRSHRYGRKHRRRIN